MKAIVISNNAEIYDFVAPLLKEKGFELIHYRWIVKALDNIEEIQPDVIVLSAVEYPRHWKTLAGFVQSGIGGNEVKVYLCETSHLSVEDAAKADELRVQAFDKAFSEKKFIAVEIAFNQKHGLIHFSSAKYYEDEALVELEYDASEGKITEGSYIDYVTLFDGNDVTSWTAEVKALERNNISLTVKAL